MQHFLKLENPVHVYIHVYELGQVCIHVHVRYRSFFFETAFADFMGFNGWGTILENITNCMVGMVNGLQKHFFLKFDSL